MSTTILELSKRLQRSLDSNYNVTDLVTVFEIIKILETTPITTEQLETTRLAYYINQLRRKTTNEQLARQAKNLLKKWRGMLIPTMPPAGAPAQATATTTAVPPHAHHVPALTNGMARSLPTTPSQITMVPNSSNNHTSGNDHVITIPDDDNDSRSTSKCDIMKGSSGGSNVAPLSIPTELTNFYLKNKQIIDIGNNVRTKTHNHLTTTTINHNNNNNNNNNSNSQGSVSVGQNHATGNNHHPYNHHHEPTISPPMAMVDESERRSGSSKRGRKKGSKGIDNYLGAAAANSLYNSNSNSGIDSPAATKKVKTTKQLVADLQNRKHNLANDNHHLNFHHNEHNNISTNNNNNASTSFLPSSPSNDSHHTLLTSGSHNDLMMVRSAPVTPSAFTMLKQEDHEAQASSIKGSSKRKRKAGTDATPSDDSQRTGVKVEKIESPAPQPSGMNFLNQIDEEIWQLKNRLPPIDRKAILRSIQMEKSELEATDQLCSCVLVECSAEEAGADPEDIPAIKATIVANVETGAVANTSLAASSSSSPFHHHHHHHQQQPQQMKSKSIFDDDDHQMSPPVIASATDKNNNSEEEGPNPRDDRFFPQRESMLLANTNANPFLAHTSALEVEPPPEPHPRTYYKYVEDPECRVKRQKEEWGRLNEAYHLPALHQLYIPQINGNWSDNCDLHVLRQHFPAKVGGCDDSATAAAAIRKAKQRKGIKRKRHASNSSNSNGSTGGGGVDDEGKVTGGDRDLNGGDKAYLSRGAGDTLIKCLERLQDEETNNVDVVVPTMNPFFHFLRPGEGRPIIPPNAHAMFNVPRYIPLRVDYSVAIVPPKEPPPPVENEAGAPPQPPPLEFNAEVTQEWGLDLKQSNTGEVYDAGELKKFLVATLRQRLSKFQMANLFYKRSWPGQEDRCHNTNLELLNSLYLNRVLEFKRKCRRKRRRRKSKEGTTSENAACDRDEEERGGGDVDVAEMDREESDEEISVPDVDLIRNLLESKSHELARRQPGSSNGGSLRRFFYVNDDRLFGQQPSILHQLDPSDPILNTILWWFPTNCSHLPTWEPFQGDRAATSFLSWARFKWHFLLDYYRDTAEGDVNRSIKAVPSHESNVLDMDTVHIHENNFRLPSFNQLTEENVIGIRQRRRGGKSATADGVQVKFVVESFRERDFLRVCMDQWPQLFPNMTFDYDAGVFVVRNVNECERWQFVAEFKDLLHEVTRLGVANEEDPDDYQYRSQNGYAKGTSIKMEPEDNSEGESMDGQQYHRGNGEEASGQSEEDLETYLFKEWHETVQVKSYNDELLTILPYVVFD